MPPKGKKASAAEKSKDLQETEDPLQAVLLADSFETKLRPFTKETPRCLLPLANTPVIEYTLEFLANSGVEEVYVYCGAHTEQIEAYFETSKWTRPSSPFSLTVLRSTSRTIGDAMRDLDKREILTNDFLVVYGDVVSNLSIEAALKEHQARRAADKNAIMTMVLRQAGKQVHSGTSVSPVFVMDPSRKWCLQYEQLRRTEGEPHSLLLDDDILTSGVEELEIRHDLVDCGIDICTPDVLALWQDNFDYEEPRRGFLHSTLKDYELNGKTIHAFIEEEAYANRVRDLRSYAMIAKDILARRTWPMCPDGTFADEHGCRMSANGLIKEDGVKVSKSAVIGKRTVLGKDTVVGSRTKIENSIIGRGCKIGPDCVIEGAHIWDDVELQEGTEIRHSIIASHAVVGRNSKIAPGSLIAFNTQLSEGTVTKPRQRLTAKSQNPTAGAQDYDPSSSSEEEGPQHSLVPTTTSRTTSASLPSSLSRAHSTDSISTLTSSRSASPSPTHHHRTTSSTSNTSLSNPSDPGRSDSVSSHTASSTSDFHKEASTSILDALLKNDDPANIQIELQGLRMAANASEHSVRKAVVAGLVSYILHQRSSGAKTSVSQIIQANGELVRRVVYDYDPESSGPKADQVDLLLLVQRELGGKRDCQVVMLSLLNALYGGDLVEGVAVVGWYEDAKSAQEGLMKEVKGHPDMEKLIAIAREEDESSEEDDGEEEDASSEDE